MILTRILLVITLISLAWGSFQSFRVYRLLLENERLETSLETAESIITFERRGREVAEEAARRIEKNRARTQKAIEAIISGEFTNADDPLDPAILDILKCLRSTQDCIPGTPDSR